MKKTLSTLLLVVLVSLAITTLRAQPQTPDTENTSCITYIPNAISPNGDGINDLFEIKHNCLISDYVIRVYDESTRLVHESRNINQAWDGTKNGAPLPEGHYSWTLTFVSENGSRINQRGDMVLVR